MKWAKSQVFERISNIYTFSKDPLLQRNARRHIFMPWDDQQVHNLMFKIKKAINDRGECAIPFMEKDLSRAFMSDEVFEEIEKQIQNQVETHLVMSNLDSIHIFRVDAVSRECRAQNSIKELEGLSKHNVWLTVGDLFVFKANHNQDSSEISYALEELITSQQTQNLFVCAQALELSQGKAEKYNQFSRWLEMNRNLTYDYFIRSCELQENVYQESWGALNRRTQHFLIMAEQGRHKGIMYRDSEKMQYLKESLECYLSAVINELNEVYIRPLINAFGSYPCLRDAWDETQAGLIHPKMQSIINELLESDRDQVKSIELFLEYVHAAKSLLFSLKKRFTKKIGKEEYLLIENFLCRQESLVESFTCKGLFQKLQSILAIKNWLRDALEKPEKLSSQELKTINLKLTHLLTIMCSTSYEDNIFFKLVEEKTSKGVVKRTFEDEVKALLKLNPLKKSA